jgi:hypothetical protein
VYHRLTTITAEVHKMIPIYPNKPESLKAGKLGGLEAGMLGS